ncbi:MAG: polysaccharide biosynthesis/export family protein [Bacteroidetes bacterium]|nr:polysaccharide biosynthesis/export family protein [Bacteroidota bacterium]
MFQTPEGYRSEALKKELVSAEKDYVIQKNDLLSLDVYSNNGERFIDPNPDLSNKTGAATKTQESTRVNYLVDQNGIGKFPLIGEIKLHGLTLRQAEEIMQKEYSKFFTDSYVKLSFVNKRVIVLGAPGGQVIPLTNQNVTVVEILATAKGLNNDAKAAKIKLIRGDQVYALDFSTFKGYTEGNMLVESGDVIYVEPVRRPFTEGLRDNSVLVSLTLSFFSIITTILLINKVK